MVRDRSIKEVMVLFLFSFASLGVRPRARYRLADSRDLRSRLTGRWWHGLGPTVKHRKLHSRAIKSMGSCYGHSTKEREARKREMDQRAVHHGRARIICFLQLPRERGRVCWTWAGIINMNAIFFDPSSPTIPKFFFTCCKDAHQAYNRSQNLSLLYAM